VTPAEARDAIRLVLLEMRHAKRTLWYEDWRRTSSCLEQVIAHLDLVHQELVVEAEKDYRLPPVS
jgi:hypothetical protein